MTEVLFYQLAHRPLEQVLPVMLERTLARGGRALVLAGSDERVEALNAQLWTSREGSFLPHGSAADGNAERQPIYLTTKFENPNRAPNGANVLFLVDGADCDRIGEFDRCADLFDGNDPAALQAARGRWRRARDSRFAVSYWQQAQDGSWQEQQ